MAHWLLCVWSLNQEQPFKQINYDEWGNMFLSPLNPEWEEQVIEVNEPALIVGVVIGKHVSF